MRLLLLQVAACDLNFPECQKVVNEFAFDYGYKNIIAIKCDVTDNDSFESNLHNFQELLGFGNFFFENGESRSDAALKN